MEDIIALERHYAQVCAFTEHCPHNAARAVALARFVQAVPEEMQGCGFYLAEISAPFLASLRELHHDVRDPELIELLRRACERLLVEDVIPSETMAEVRQWLQSKASDHPHPGAPTVAADGSRRGGSTAASNGSCPDEPAEASQICLKIPLVFTLPRTPGSDMGSEHLGLLVDVTVAPRIVQRGAPRFIWNNGFAGQGAGSLRSLEDVTADAFLAAREVVTALTAPSDDNQASLASTLVPKPAKAGILKRIDLDRLGFDLSIPEKSIPVAGDSIGLGLAVAIAGTLLGCSSRGKALRPREDLAWTGQILPSGEVVPVDRDALRAKVRAALYAGARGIVVPRGMAPRLDAGLRSLNGEEILEVFEVGHVREVFTQSDLMEPWTLPEVIPMGCTRQRWGRTAALVAGIAALLVFLLHCPPVPQSVEQTTRDTLKVTFKGFLWPPLVIEEAAGITFHMMTEDIKGDAPGKARLVYLVQRSNEQVSPGRLVVYDPVWRREVWSHVVCSSGLSHDLRDEYPDGVYAPKTVCIADVDADGFNEMVLAGVLQPYAPSFLWLLDGLNGPVGTVYHPGHLERLMVEDVDGDGQLEILALGHHGPSAGVALVVLHAEQFQPFREHMGNGQSGTERFLGSSPGTAAADKTSSWHPGRQACVMHLVVPMIEGLEQVEGRGDLGHVGLGVVPSEHVPRLIQFAINAARRMPPSSDYILSVKLPGEVVKLTVNAVMGDLAHYWLEQGMTRINFASDSLVSAWQETLRFRDYIQIDWTDPAPSRNPPSESRRDSMASEGTSQ
ncbi:MAG: hypothetical protein KAY24_15515 [Candidatus Eisenbacteria sp.]|nr:hypothetical protein [Candidatus Eisenbacteria bacterium]